VHLPQGKLAQLCASEWDKWAVEDIREKKMSWLFNKKHFSVRGPGKSLHFAHILFVVSWRCSMPLPLTGTATPLVLQGYQDLGIFPVHASMDSLAQLRMGFELKYPKIAT